MELDSVRPLGEVYADSVTAVGTLRFRSVKAAATLDVSTIKRRNSKNTFIPYSHTGIVPLVDGLIVMTSNSRFMNPAGFTELQLTLRQRVGGCGSAKEYLRRKYADPGKTPIGLMAAIFPDSLSSVSVIMAGKNTRSGGVIIYSPTGKPVFTEFPGSANLTTTKIYDLEGIGGMVVLGVDALPNIFTGTEMIYSKLSPEQSQVSLSEHPTDFAVKFLNSRQGDRNGSLITVSIKRD